MTLSIKRRDDLYRAIHEPIMDLRVAEKFTDGVDTKVAQLETTIWRRVLKALGAAHADQELK